MRGLGCAAVAVLVLVPAPPPPAEVVEPAGASQARPAAASDTLTLTEAVRIGLGEDPDIRTERASREGASGQRLADLGAFLPSVTAGASFSRFDFTNFTFVAPEGSSRRLDEPETGVRKSSSQDLRLNWTLLDGGRRIADWQAGGARVEAARHRVSAVERQTVAEVRVAYVRALEQRELVAVAEGRLEARRRDLELARRRYAIADADRSEILGARSDTLDARMRLLEARDLSRARTRALREAMGVERERLPVGTPLARLGSLPELGALEVAELVRRSVRSHPELEALEAEGRAASADRWAARSNYLPTVDLGYSLSRNERLGREGDFFVLDPSNDQQRLSLSVSWNLFDGLEREARAARASADLRRARAQRTKRRIELETAVRDLAGELERRRRRLDLLRRKVALARERVEVTRERFRLGDVSYLELQQVIERLDAAERQRIVERYGYLRAWAELERRTGPLPGRELPSPGP